MSRRIRDREQALPPRKGYSSPPGVTSPRMDSPSLLSTSDRHMSDGHLRALQADKDALTKTLESVQRQNALLREGKQAEATEVDRLNHELSRERTRTQLLERELSESRRISNSPPRMSTEDIQRENDDLRRALEAAKSGEEREVFRTKLGGVEEELRISQEKLRSFESAARDATKALEDERESAAQYRDEAIMLRAQVAERPTEKALEDERESAAQYRDEAAKLRAQVAERPTASDVDHLRAELEAAARRLESVGGEKKLLEEALQEAEGRASRSGAEHATYAEELRRELNEAPTTAEVTQLKQELNAVGLESQTAQRVAGLLLDSVARRSRGDELRSELDKVQSELAYGGMAQRLQAQLDAAREECERSRRDGASDLQRTSSDMAAKSELSVVNAQLEASRNECERLRTEVSAGLQFSGSSKEDRERLLELAQRESELDAREEKLQMAESCRHSGGAVEQSGTQEQGRRQELQQAQTDLLHMAELKDDAETEACLLKSQLAEVEDELRNTREGLVISSELRARKSELAAKLAEERADEARRDLADAEALRRKVSVQFPPIGAEAVEAAFISSWKLEAAGLLRRMQLLRTTNRVLECEAMRTHDEFRTPPRGGGIFLGVVVFLLAALATAAAIHAVYVIGVLQPYLEPYIQPSLPHLRPYFDFLGVDFSMPFVEPPPPQPASSDSSDFGWGIGRYLGL